ncbi:hypothetical protein ACIP88_12205 [Streptomyces uncialis]|uniref:hypothetical protein n=1 Tax=Streptomyces uncialis TaxID=1048205 RepID=UPI0037F920C5
METTPVGTIAVGTLVIDTAGRRIGRFEDSLGSRCFLRPLGGGREWTVDPDHVRQATEAEILAAKVAAANARSTGAVR